MPAECHTTDSSRTACSRCRWDTANDQIVFLAYSAFGEACGNIIVVLKLITNLMKGNNFGVGVKSLTASSKSRLAEALATFISVDNVRAQKLFVKTHQISNEDRR